MILAIIQAEKRKDELMEGGDDAIFSDLQTNQTPIFVEQFEQEVSYDIFQSFLNVVHMKFEETYECKGRVIFDAMNLMKMKDREKGDVTSLRKFKSLLGRWFGSKKEEAEEKDKTIKRGSVVYLGEESTSPIYVVFVVWKVLGKKWFTSVLDNNPSWPIKKSEVGSYRLGLRKLERNVKTGLLAYRNHEFIVGGRETTETSYKMIRPDDIKENLMRVSI